MTGTKTDARKVLSGEGMFIGEGSFRECYLINDVVYKLNITSQDANFIEFHNGEAARGNVPAPFIVPAMSLFDIDGESVLAMEYINGESTGECTSVWLDLPCECDGKCMPENIRVMALSISDDCLSWGNTIRVGSDYYLIDLDADLTHPQN